MSKNISSNRWTERRPVTNGTRRAENRMQFSMPPRVVCTGFRRVCCRLHGPRGTFRYAHGDQKISSDLWTEKRAQKSHAGLSPGSRPLQTGLKQIAWLTQDLQTSAPRFEARKMLQKQKKPGPGGVVTYYYYYYYYYYHRHDYDDYYYCYYYYYFYY